MLINSPPTGSVDALTKRDGVYTLSGVLGGWRNFFQAVYSICNALTTSGTTADRPTTMLWIGRTYFDTTLTRPIWVSQVTPAVVWIRADGVVV